MSPGVSSRLAALESFVARACDNKLDPQLASDLCKLGAVVACGTVERCVEIIILDRLSNKADKRVLNFVRSHFKRGRNYDCEEIEKLLHRFDSKWCDSFKTKINSAAGVREAVSSCYAVRNSVAHGGAQNIGPAILKSYSQLIVDMIRFLDQSTAK